MNSSHGTLLYTQDIVNHFLPTGPSIVTTTTLFYDVPDLAEEIACWYGIFKRVIREVGVGTVISERRRETVDLNGKIYG